MAATRVIAIVGATGGQGGGLADAVLSDPESGYAVRALTRDPGSLAATVLAGRGAEVVQADLDDAVSLAGAFEGADAAYCRTSFCTHTSAEKEVSQAANLARATEEAGVEHVIWSTFSDDRRRPRMDDGRTTLLRTSFHWENLIDFGLGPQRGEDGSLTITFPLGEAAMPGMAATDVGRCAWGIVKAGDRFRGRAVGILGESLTGARLAAAVGRAIGEDVRYQDVPADVFRSFGFPGADELFADTGERDLAVSRELNPALQNFDTWLSRNAADIPIGG